MPSCRVYSNCFLVTRRTTLPPDKQSRRAAQTVTKCTPDQNSERASTLMHASPYCQVHRHTTTTCPSPPAAKQLLTVRCALALFLSQIRTARSPMLPSLPSPLRYLDCSRKKLLSPYFLPTLSQLLHCLSAASPWSAGVRKSFRQYLQVQNSERRTHTYRHRHTLAHLHAIITTSHTQSLPKIFSAVVVLRLWCKN